MKGLLYHPFLSLYHQSTNPQLYHHHHHHHTIHPSACLVDAKLHILSQEGLRFGGVRGGEVEQVARLEAFIVHQHQQLTILPEQSEGHHHRVTVR